MTKTAPYILLLTSFMFVACGSKSHDIKSHDIVGTWTFDEVSKKTNAGLTFKSDGTWSRWFKTDSVKNESSGTYTLQGDTLHLVQKKAVNFGKFSESPVGSDVKIAWVSEDKIKIGGESTYTRKK